MDILFWKNETKTGSYGLCHVECWQDLENEAGDALFKNEYHGYYETQLSTPEKLFSKFAHLQPWGGSPGIESAYYHDFSDRIIFTLLKMEQTNDEKESVQVSHSDKDSSIRIVFSNKTAFQHFMNRARRRGKINDSIYMDDCGFES
jgi:hypothetical protein